MSRTVGYARVSSKEQNLDRQIKALSEYVAPDMIVTDKSTGMNFERDGYKSLKVGIGRLRRGDTLFITSLDRLSRNKAEVKNELKYFQSQGIKLKILDIPTTLTDFPDGQDWVADMVTNILIEVLSSINENEVRTIRKRQLEGYNAMPVDTTTGKRISRKTGRTVGRPAVTFPDNWKEIYPSWKNGDITAREAMRRMELKPNSFYKLVKKYETSN